MRRSVLATGMFIAAAVIPFAGCDGSEDNPTDAQMVRELESRKGAFLDLLKMAQEDTHLTRVARDFIQTDVTDNVTYEDRPRYLSDERWARYRALFDQLALKYGIGRREDGSVVFSRSGGGMILTGAGKDFIWSRSPIASALPPTDPRTLKDACGHRRCYVVHRIAPEWYIAYRND